MLTFFQTRILFLIALLSIIFIGTLGTLTAIPVFIFLVFVIIMFGTSFLGSYWLPLSDEVLDIVIRESKLKQGQKFYDLGSGDGRVVVSVARRTEAEAIGIEIEPIKWLYSVIKIKVHGLNAHVRRESFFTADIKDADVVFMWLPSQTVKKLQPKLRKLRKGTIVICYQFVCSDLKHVKTVKIKEPLHIHRVP